MVKVLLLYSKWLGWMYNGAELSTTDIGIYCTMAPNFDKIRVLSCPWLKEQCRQAILSNSYTCKFCVKLTCSDCKHKIN